MGIENNKMMGFLYGRTIKKADGIYEVHWYTTVTDNNNQEVCEKCGAVYYDTKPCSCNEATPYLYVSSLREAEKILSQKPFHPFIIRRTGDDT